MDGRRGREENEVSEILLTTALPFDSISDGALTDGCLSLEKVIKAQEKCSYGFVGAG